LYAHLIACASLQNTPKPARKAPPPPSNHVVNEEVEQISRKSSSNGSEEILVSPESKARSSSDSKVEVSEPKRSRSSRSRSSSVEIDENVHRNLEQQQDQPLSNGQGTIPMGFATKKDLYSGKFRWVQFSQKADLHSLIFTDTCNHA
jgi:hypothetical protein